MEESLERIVVEVATAEKHAVGVVDRNRVVEKVVFESSVAASVVLRRIHSLVMEEGLVVEIAGLEEDPKAVVEVVDID